MSADRDRGIRRQKQKRAKDSKRKARQRPVPTESQRGSVAAEPLRPTVPQ